MTPELVVLVDEADNQIGTMEKQKAHENGCLHRAMSVVIIDSEGRWLLQKRAGGKYHSPGLWANACCGHPRPGEAVRDAANRRLKEELGLETVLNPWFTFSYRASVGAKSTEHEFDHVFVGKTDETPIPATEEVEDWRYASPTEIGIELENVNHQFAAWFEILFRHATLAANSIR